MDIQEIKVNNFLSFKEVQFDFSNQGLTLITGYNKDNSKRSNGSGKSSIIEALVWGLFGETTKRLKADEVINREEFADCSVILNVVDAGNEYKIERYRKHIKHKNDLKFFVNGEEKKGKTNTETQELINSELGIDFKIFTNSVLFPQESKFKFVSATDNEKKEILTEILDLGYIDEAEARVSSRLKNIQMEIHDDKMNLDNLDKKKCELGEDAVSFAEKATCFEEDRSKSISDLKNKIIDYEKKIALIYEEAKLRKHDADKFEKNRKKIIANLQGEIESLKKKMGEIKVERDVDLKEKIEKLEKKLKVIDETKEKRSSYKNKIGSIENKIEKFEDLINDTKEKISKFEKLGKADCPTCLQQVPDEHVDAIADGYRSEIEDNKERIVAAKLNISEIQKKVDQCDELIAIESKIKTKIKTINEEIYKRKEQLLQYESYNEKIENIEIRISDKQNEKNPFNVNVEDVNSKADNHREEIEYVKKQIDTKVAEKNPYNEMMSSHKDKIKKTKEDIKKLKIEIKEKEEEAQYYEFWKEGFSNKGMKSFIFDGVVNDINDKMEEYLDEMFDGMLKVQFSNESLTASGEIRQKLSTNIAYNDEEVTFESLSGGEKRSISLAVDLALSSLIAQRNFKKFGLLILDECVDHLDDIGKERFLDLLHTLSKDSVFLISHDTQFQQKFDNIVKIQKENGESIIV